MVRPDSSTTQQPTFNPFTGKPLAESTALPRAAALGLEPPRYCERCGRRMVVQVSPDGWWARCSRHGTLTSADARRDGATGLAGSSW
jgi:hypothetical protein